MRCPSCDSEEVVTTTTINMNTGVIGDIIALCMMCSYEWRPGDDLK